jgi:hypothetical protein
MVLSAASPMGTADYTSKSEHTNPDATIYGFESGTAEDNKSGERLMGGGSSTTETVNVTLKKKGGSPESSSVTFPYEKFDWKITKCYRSSNGLRFYGVYYKEEKILYDYRVPWIEIDDEKFDLTSVRSNAAPDLYIWETLEVFKVSCTYTIQDEHTDVEVYAYFYKDGRFDPWVLVDSNQKKNFVVGQRFDFDLDGASDDNADFYKTSGWDLVENEDSHLDDGNPEDNHVQWRLYDTDVNGTGYINDQLVKIIPYNIDSSFLYIVRYHTNEMTGDPSLYDNNEATGLYSIPTYDPFIGYDLVAWYVSEYLDTRSCNPGPWTQVEV